MRQTLSILVIIVFFLVTISCAGRDNAVNSTAPAMVSESGKSRDLSYLPSVYCGEATIVPLIAGQSTVIGEVIITNGDQYLNTECVTWAPWVLAETHIAVADSLDGIPQTKTGNPKVGQFDYTIDSWIDLSWYEGTLLYIAADAEVWKLNENGEVIQEETAWGEGTSFPGSNWAMYFNYTVQNCMPGWARTWGGNWTDIGSSVATDGLGNTYVAGYFSSEIVDFDPGLGEDWHTLSNPVGNSNAFLSKFDPSGNFLWAKTWGGSLSFGSSSNDVAIDGSGNVCMTGTFYGTLDFDPGLGDDSHTSNSAEMDVFLIKLDSSGNFLWTKTWGGNSADSGNGVTTNESGNVYVIGTFGPGTLDFNPGPGVDNHTSNGNYDVFLSKLDSSGNFLWAKTWGGNYGDGSADIINDGSDNICVTGYFDSTIVDFDPDTGEDWHTLSSYPSPSGGPDVFLTKLDPSGNFLWAKTWGGNYQDYGDGITTDGSGNIYVTGLFLSGTVDFDPGLGVDNHTSNGNYDVFLSKFDSSGNFLWAKTWGGVDNDEGWGVATDGTSSVYATGYFSGSVDLDPSSGNELRSSVNNQSGSPSTDIFLSKFDSLGNFLGANTWGGSDTDYGWDIVVDMPGNIYVTGSFGMTADFDPGPGEDNHTSNGTWDVFLRQFLSDANW